MGKRLATIVLALSGVVVAFAQESQPATTTAAATIVRINELVALIEGQNTPDVRRTGAKELLRQRWPEGVARLTALLSGPNNAAKLAVSGALLEVPEALDPVYIDPLMAMLGDNDAALRQAASAALAAYPDNGVIERLRRLATDGQGNRIARLAAISALGLMTERDAIVCLSVLLDDSDPLIAQAAASAMAQATASDFGDDVAAARAWWDGCSNLSTVDWQQMQIERLVRKDREMRRRLETTETRLAKALEAGFLRAADAERATLLAGYLADTALTLRMLGMRLIQLHLAEGKALPPELRDRVRELLAAHDAREQALAVQTVTSFRDTQDAERLLEMLKTASRDVRLAVVNGLGYVGGADAAEPLVDALDGADEGLATELVAALGRLAERGVLPTSVRPPAVNALLAVFERTLPAKVALRERVLWAMANIADVKFAPAFTAGLDRQEAVAVRQAAVRGLMALKSAQYVDALITASTDPDVGVRKLAIEGISVHGSGVNEKHIQALWERVIAPQETDETIRQLAWRGVLDLLAKAPADDAERWLARMPTSSRTDADRAVELLERLEKAALEADPVDPARLGRVRARLAVQYAKVDKPNEAIAAYLGALDNLSQAKSDTVSRTSLELLRYALSTEHYDAQVAAALGRASPAAERAVLWQAVRAEVESRLTPDGCERALNMLTSVERHPPGAWPESVLGELQSLRTRAQQIKQSAGEPATRPAFTAAR
jgi:HEAT repeat protein